MGSDKRRSDRHSVRFQLAYDDGDSYSVGIVRDLSHHGMFLETAMPAGVGSVVNLTSLEVEDGGHFELSARVVRVELPSNDRLDAPGMAIEYEGLDDEQRLFLQSLIERLEDEEGQTRGERDPFFGKALPRMGAARSASGIWRSRHEGPTTVEAAAPDPDTPDADLTESLPPSQPEIG